MIKHTVDEVLRIVGPLPFKMIGKWMIQICNALKSEMEGRGTESFIPLCPSLLNVTDEMNIEYDPGSYIFHPPEKHSEIVPPGYWSPEQAKDNDLSLQSTFYSFGVMAFEMATGHLPFSTHSKADLLLAHMRVEPPKASSRRFDISPGLENLIARLLSKDGSKRFSSPDEIASEISRMTLKEDSTGIKARGILEGLFKNKSSIPAAPTFSIQTRVKDEGRGTSMDPEASRATVRMKIPVFNGPPSWEKDLKVTAHTGKVTLTFTTETAASYTCKVAKRDSGAVVSHTCEDQPSMEHKFEVSGLESGASYSATIFNETDFVMRNFKTPVALV